MLRRRILTSAMASVMALTSVAVVANADDAVVAVEKQVLEKADLKAVLDKYAADRDKALNEYGSVCGEDFLDALEYAENVLDDADATKADYTVAAQMVEGTHAHLVKKTQQELRDLIKECRVIYDRGNILNEDLGDLRYTEGSFDAFETALGDAESVLDSNDSRLWTDSWFELKDKKDGLTSMATVTKSAFRQALKNYDQAIAKQYAYEPWRVGVEGNGNEIAYGVMYSILASVSDRVHNRYNDIDEIKGLYETSQEEIVQAWKDVVKVTEEFNKWAADDTDRANKANVSKLLSQYHGRLVRDYVNTTGANDYSAWGLLDSIAVVDDEVKVETPKNPEIQSGSEFIDFLLLRDFTKKFDLDAYRPKEDRIWYITSQKVDNDLGGDKQEKLISAEVNAKSTVKYYIPVWKESGYWTGQAVTTDPDAYKGSDSIKLKVVNAKTVVDLSQFIEVKAENITEPPSSVINNHYNGVIDELAETPQVYKDSNGKWGLDQNPDVVTGEDEDVLRQDFPAQTFTQLDIAVEMAYFYLNGQNNPNKFLDSDNNNHIALIDTNGTIADGSAKGSTAEWTLVNRYLSYALADKYASAKSGLKTKIDVKNLIDQSYDLTEATGDATLFSINHQNLVAKRKAAIGWLADVNKMKKYADNIDTGEYDDNGNVQYLIAHKVWTELHNAYVALEKDYNAFKYSYGDVYNYIYDVCAKVDDGTLVLTDELKAAIQETAYRLSVVETSYEDETWNFANDWYEAEPGVWKYHRNPIDNDAFTSDRYFLPYNRVYTDQTWGYWGDAPAQICVDGGNGAATRSHIALREEYNKLQAEVKKQTEPEVKLGDVNGDGAVNPLDATEILKAVVGLRDPIDVKVGDVNADGAVNQLDATKILKDYVGITE